MKCKIYCTDKLGGMPILLGKMISEFTDRRGLDGIRLATALFSGVVNKDNPEIVNITCEKEVYVHELFEICRLYNVSIEKID